MRYEHGRILAVNQETLGGTLVGDVLAGATSVTVDDAADFDETGGWLKIGDQVAEYETVDDDTGEITFADGTTLDVAGAEGDDVFAWDPLYETITTELTADVEVDGDDENEDPLECSFAHHLVDRVVEGIRGLRGESVRLELDGDDWIIVDILGLAADGATGQRWEADDVYVLTAVDITAGVATCPLSQRPDNESVDAKLAGVPQEPTEYTVNYANQTITWPLDGFELEGDRLWFHYTYQTGVAAPTPELPYGSPDWKYLQVATTDATDRSASSYDDTGFATGTSPFSNALTGLGIPTSATWLDPATASWAADTDLWLRRVVRAAPNQPVTVTVRVDNYLRGLYWNGTLIGSYMVGDVAENSFTVPASQVLDTNTIALRIGDDPGAGDRTYVDVDLEGAS